MRGRKPSGPEGTRRGAVAGARRVRVRRWGLPPARPSSRPGRDGGTRMRLILCASAALRRSRAGSAPAMTDLGAEYSERAAIFRRLADELKNEEARAALLAIAEEYEAESMRRRRGAGL